MGFETFQVEVRGGKAGPAEAAEAVRCLPHVKPARDFIPMKGSTFYVVDDGQHIIELELVEAPLRISCRFTLCHPASVGPAFLGLVRELMASLGAQASICDDVRPEHSRPFLLAEFEEFAAAASTYIATRRAEWAAAFGDESLAATTSEAYERIILPRCLPVSEQPKRHVS
jgi:hypothetical protein